MPARAKDFIPHEFVAWKGVKAFRVIRLIERDLKIERFVVQRDVGKARAGKVHHADFSHAEIAGRLCPRFARFAMRLPLRKGNGSSSDHKCAFGTGTLNVTSLAPTGTERVASGRPPELKCSVREVFADAAALNLALTVTLPESMSGVK